MESSPSAPPLISTAAPRRTDRIAAIVIVALSLLGLAVMVPFADVQWPPGPAFIQMDDTGLSLIALITAILLIGQFLQVGKRSMLVLACGYLFTSWIIGGHLLSNAVALAAMHAWIANDETAAWIFAFWRGVFPIFVMLYALASGSARDRPMTRTRLAPMIGLCIAAAFVAAALCVLFAIAMAPHQRPALWDGREFDRIAAGVTWTISAIALATLYIRTRARSILDMWLCVVLFAWLLDISIAGLISPQIYTLGWYAGRIYGLVAASIVLSALLLETGTLYARMITLLGEMRAQAAELSRSEAALRQAQKMEAIGQLTGGVAHDFNNLLTVIIGSLDMLRQEQGGGPRASRLTDYAMEAAVKGEKLTKQLLAFSRQQMVNPEVRDPNRLIREFDGLVRRAIGAAIQIDLDLDDAAGRVRVDPAQFESAILNLAVNARDAMGGTGRITIQTRAASDAGRPGDYVMIAVSDTGCGMDAETVSRVLEPFFTTKPTGQGSGLGLSQVYGFTNSSGGSVKIESAPGEGTTVRLYLPRTDEEPATPHAEPPAAPPQGAGGETVLVVEDDPGVLDIVVETMADLGYGVLTACNSHEAMAFIGGGTRIDLLFSDIVMPDSLNGIELAIEARRIRPGLPILLTSGYADRALTDGTPLPADVEIIAKPYRLDELARKLREVLAS
jgi:signal transduction histidine kinase/CheY-like chemotaxis protein